MCVIIHKPADARPSLQMLEACATNNPDGWGIMFVDDGRVQTIKDVNNAKFFRIYEELKDRELGIHFRWKTHGLIDFENTHPYRVLDPEQHQADVWLMHNGVISIKQRDKKRSDTWHFVNDLLQPILAHTGPHVLREPSFQELLETRIGHGSKLLLLDEENTFVKINEDAGIELEGCWLSNSYSHTLTSTSGKVSQATRRTIGYTGSYGYRSNTKLYGRSMASWEEDDDWWENDPNYAPHIDKGMVREGTNGVALLPAPSRPDPRGTSDYPLGDIEVILDQNEDDQEAADRAFDRTVEDYFREYEGHEDEDYFLPGPETLAMIPDVHWEDLTHLSRVELKEFFKLRPEVAAEFFHEATA